MQVKATSTGPVGRVVVGGLVEDEDVPAGAVAAVTLVDVPLSRVELVAALFSLSWLSEDTLAAMTGDEVRRYVASVVLDSGRMVVVKAACQLSECWPVGVAFLALCERRIDEAFGFDRNELDADRIEAGVA